MTVGNRYLKGALPFYLVFVTDWEKRRESSIFNRQGKTSTGKIVPSKWHTIVTYTPQCQRSLGVKKRGVAVQRERMPSNCGKSHPSEELELEIGKPWLRYVGR